MKKLATVLYLFFCLYSAKIYAQNTTVMWTNLRNLTPTNNGLLYYPGPGTPTPNHPELDYGVASSFNVLNLLDTGRFTFTVSDNQTVSSSGHTFYGLSISNDLYTDVPLQTYPYGAPSSSTDYGNDASYFPMLIFYFDIHDGFADIYQANHKLGSYNAASGDQFTILKYFIAPLSGTSDPNYGIYGAAGAAGAGVNNSIVFLKNGATIGISGSYSIDYCDQCNGPFIGVDFNIGVVVEKPGVQIGPVICTFGNSPGNITDPFNFNIVWDQNTTNLIHAMVVDDLTVKTTYSGSSEDSNFYGTDNPMAQAVSANKLEGTLNGYIQLQPNYNDLYLGGSEAFGFATVNQSGPANGSSSGIPNMSNLMIIVFDPDYDIDFYAGNTYGGSLGSLQQGDWLYIYRHAGDFAFVKNGEIINATSNYKYSFPKISSAPFGISDNSIDQSNFSMNAIFACTGYQGALFDLNASFGPVIANAGLNQAVCSGSSIGDSPSAFGGKKPYSYSWAPPAALDNSTLANPHPSASSTTSTTYTLTVTDANQSTATSTATIVVNPLPTTTASSNSPICLGNTLNLSSSGGTSYLWTGPASFTSTLQNPSVANAASANAGTYTVTATNASGCSASSSASVTVNALPVPTASSNSPICSGNTLNLSSSGGTSYLWTGPASFTSTLQNPMVSTNATTDMAGTYSVTARVNGCSSVGSTSVIVYSNPPTPTVTVTNNCNGSSTLSTTATGTLLWSPGNATTASITATVAQAYSVTGTVNGCTSAAGTGAATTYSTPATPTISVTNNCGSSTLSTSATGSLLWSTGEATLSITVTSAGTYSVTQTVNSCTSLAGTATAVPFIIPSAPTVAIVNNCGSSTLSTTATGSLLWSTSATTSSIIATSSGSYAVTATINGCISAAGSGTAAPIPIPSPPAVTVTNNCNSTSVLSTTATGNLLWSTGGTTTSITITATGNYTVTVTDANACVAAGTATVTVPDVLTATISSTNVNCYGTSTGSATVSVNGGTSQYSYSWSPIGGAAATASNLPAGSYTVTIIDNNSCTTTATANINNPLCTTHSRYHHGTN